MARTGNEKMSFDVNLLMKANKLWRDQTARARFEAETGMAPILPAGASEIQLEAQQQSGVTGEYHARFIAWAGRQQ
jgi:hypothetical protein